MSEQKKPECTCDDLTDLERYYGDHYDDCPLSDYKQGSSEYPEGARFAWDMIHLTETEIDDLVSYADAGMFEEAEAVVDRAEERMYGQLL